MKILTTFLILILGAISLYAITLFDPVLGLDFMGVQNELGGQIIDLLCGALYLLLWILTFRAWSRVFFMKSLEESPPGLFQR